MKHLLSVDVKREDYEWEPVPEPPQPPQPAAGTITADELAERMRVYVEKILADPNWRAEQERKQVEKAERRKAREERLAAKRQRKAA